MFYKNIFKIYDIFSKNIFKIYLIYGSVYVIGKIIYTIISAKQKYSTSKILSKPLLNPISYNNQQILQLKSILYNFPDPILNLIVSYSYSFSRILDIQLTHHSSISFLGELSNGNIISFGGQTYEGCDISETDNTICIWDPKYGTLLKTIIKTDLVKSLCLILPNAHIAIAYSNTITIYDTKTMNTKTHILFPANIGSLFLVNNQILCSLIKDNSHSWILYDYTKNSENIYYMYQEKTFKGLFYDNCVMLENGITIIIIINDNKEIEIHGFDANFSNPNIILKVPNIKVDSKFILDSYQDSLFRDSLKILISENKIIFSYNKYLIIADLNTNIIQTFELSNKHNIEYLIKNKIIIISQNISTNIQILDLSSYHFINYNLQYVYWYFNILIKLPDGRCIITADTYDNTNINIGNNYPETNFYIVDMNTEPPTYDSNILLSMNPFFGKYLLLKDGRVAFGTNSGIIKLYR